MTQLYTVTMNRMVMHYTSAGKEERPVQETYHDLPLALAQRYQQRFPDAGVKITPTEKNRQKGRPGSQIDRDQTQPRRGAFRVSNETQAQRKAKGLPPRAAKPAGGYADLVNVMMKEA